MKFLLAFATLALFLAGCADDPAYRFVEGRELNIPMDATFLGRSRLTGAPRFGDSQAPVNTPAEK